MLHSFVIVKELKISSDNFCNCFLLSLFAVYLFLMGVGRRAESLQKERGLAVLEHHFCKRNSCSWWRSQKNLKGVKRFVLFCFFQSPQTSFSPRVSHCFTFQCLMSSALSFHIHVPIVKMIQYIGQQITNIFQHVAKSQKHHVHYFV